MNNYLHANNVNKNFIQSSINFNVLKKIEFKFKQSKTYSIMGVSGTGKSTLINLLAGLDLPCSGNIYYNEIDINTFSKEKKSNFLNTDIGLVFQEPYLIKELTVLENIMLKGLIKKINYQNCHDLAILLLKKVGLVDKRNDLPATLSVGQQQRVSILRAIFNEPKFLLADEPTANLDYDTAKTVINLLLEYKFERNMSLIITTHDKQIANCMEMKLQLKDGLLVF